MWIGKPGAFFELPDPTGEMTADPDLGATVHDLLQGKAVDFRGGRVTRTYTAQFEGITADDWSVLHGLVTRQYGRGPWTVYRSETRENLLTPQQASGSTVENDNSGFLAAGTGETLTSQTTTVRTAGMSALAWALPTSPSGGILQYVSPYDDLDGWATQAGHVWAFGAYVRTGASGDTAFDVRAVLRWLDSAGALISESTGTYTAITNSGFTRVSVAATAPANAAYVEPRVQIDLTDISGGSTATLYVADAQLELASALSAQIAGSGPPRVSLLAPKHRQPVAEWSNYSLTFQEV